MLHPIMAIVMFQKKFFFAIACMVVCCASFAQDSNNSVDVQQYLQQNSAPQTATHSANPPGSNFDADAQSAMRNLGKNSSGLFSAATDLVKPSQNSKPTGPPPTTTISAPVAQTNPASRALPTKSQQQAAAGVTDSSAAPVEIKIPTKQEMNKDSFEGLKQNAFPLSPNQIKTLHNMLDDTQRATAATPYDAPPEPVSSSLVVNLSPGSTPPAIRLYRGFVSSLVFVDSTGAPWPIVAYDLGNPSAFNIAWNTKDNLLMVQAQSSYNYGNLAVKLQDLDTPVMLTLVPGQKAVDYRVDLRIMERGPNAKASYSGTSTLPASTSPVLLNILDAVPPQGAKALSIPDNTAQAWLYNNKIYLRTSYVLLSPAWVAKLSSADGMNAYELVKTPLVLLSRHGKTVQTRIEGF